MTTSRAAPGAVPASGLHHSDGAGSVGPAPAASWARGRNRADLGLRLGVGRFEVEHLDLGRDAVLAAGREPLRGLGLDLLQAAERLLEHGGDFAPALFVDRHRDPAELTVLELVEGARDDGLADVVEDRLQQGAGEARAQRLRDASPARVAEELAPGRAVEVLGGTSP